MKIEIQGKISRNLKDWFFKTKEKEYSDNIITAIDEILELNGFSISNEGQKYIITVETVI